MSTTSRRETGPRTRGLRANALAGLIMLLIEYSLGISANLHSTLPASDRGKTLFAGVDQGWDLRHRPATRRPCPGCGRAGP